MPAWVLGAHAAVAGEDARAVVPDGLDGSGLRVGVVRSRWNALRARLVRVCLAECFHNPIKHYRHANHFHFSKLTVIVFISRSNIFVTYIDSTADETLC